MEDACKVCGGAHLTGACTEQSKGMPEDDLDDYGEFPQSLLMRRQLSYYPWLMVRQCEFGLPFSSLFPVQTAILPPYA